MVVGQQWRAGGTSLYGNYWVDRPPVLMTIYSAAARLGGAVPLRLFGIVAAALVVLLAARLAGQLGGRRASAGAAIVAAVLLANPALGAESVNGELLAAPVVLAGLSCAVAALRASTSRIAVVGAAGAGALAVTALLIKQNMADVAVFAIVAGALSCWRGDVAIRRLAALAAAGLGGGLAMLAVVAGWIAVHGTSLHGVYEAMYPFRLDAARVMNTYGSAGGAAGRAQQLALVTLTSGLIVLVVMCCWAALTRRIGGPFVWALVVLLVFDGVSILMGGNFWSHYLVQPLGVVAVLSGLVVSGWRRPMGALVAAVAVVAAAGWVQSAVATTSSPAEDIGTAIRSSSAPGDTVFSAWGNAGVVQASGLSSPYRYLWSLPIKTLDPQLALLNRTLAGPEAPTWIVAWHHFKTWGLDTTQTRQLVQLRYHQVAAPCGHTIYLLDGVNRPAPTVSRCTTEGAL